MSNSHKLIMESWRGFLQEVDGDGPLGKYVIPNRKLDREGEEEKNTEFEDRLQKALFSHFATGRRSLPRNMTNFILQMIEGGNYPEIFKLYTGGTVYRGMNLRKEKFEELFGELPQPQKWYKAPIDWLFGRSQKTNVNLPFSPTSKPKYSPGLDTTAGSWASSWTTSFGQASDFSEIAGNIPIILVADASENTFIDMDPFYDNYTFASGFEDEKEKVGVGDINLKSIYVYDVGNHQ